jgi:hypothetical protein
MERSDAPGEWTTRQVLCHLLFEPGWRPGAVLFSFVPADLPVIEIKPGQMYLTPERQIVTLRPFEKALDRHRREALAYRRRWVTRTFSGRFAFRCSSGFWAPTRSQCRRG